MKTRKEKLQYRLNVYLEKLNGDPDHIAAVKRDYSGNTGDYRVAYYFNADGLESGIFLSDFYSCFISSRCGLSQRELEDLARRYGF